MSSLAENVVRQTFKIAADAQYLPCCCRHGFTNAIELLAAAGADLAAQDKNGDTALHLAVKNKEVDAVAALLEAGAPVNAVNAAGRTALGEARRMGYGTMVTFLQRHNS